MGNKVNSVVYRKFPPGLGVESGPERKEVGQGNQ